VEFAIRHDVVVVAAVGLPGGLGKVPAPASIPGVVAVSGVDKAGAIVASVSGPEVVIAAPGKDIAHATKGGGYALGTGTSDATAIVSGVVALIRSKYPDLDAANVVNRLIQTADDRGPPGRDQRYGFGIVNPVRALTADVPRVDRNPLLAGVGQASSPTSAGPSQMPRSAAGSDSRSPWIWLGVALAALAIASLLALHATTRRSRRPAGIASGSGGRTQQPPSAATEQTQPPPSAATEQAQWPARAPAIEQTQPPPGAAREQTQQQP
jgi:subtilisin family serine protease